MPIPPNHKLPIPLLQASVTSPYKQCSRLNLLLPEKHTGPDSTLGFGTFGLFSL